jgi:hypothetical protein
MIAATYLKEVERQAVQGQGYWLEVMSAWKSNVLGCWTSERHHLQTQDANHVLRDGALAHALHCRSLQVSIHFRIWVNPPFGL